MSHAKSEVSTFAHVNRSLNDNDENSYSIKSEAEKESEVEEAEKVIEGLILILRKLGHFAISTENLQLFTLLELKKIRAKLLKFNTLQREGKIPAHLQKLPNKSNPQAFLACILDSETLLQDFIDYHSSIGSSEERAYWFELSLYLGNEIVPKWLLILNKNELYTQNWLDKCARSGNLEMLKYYININASKFIPENAYLWLAIMTTIYSGFKIFDIAKKIDNLPACQNSTLVPAINFHGYSRDTVWIDGHPFESRCADEAYRKLHSYSLFFTAIFASGLTPTLAGLLALCKGESLQLYQGVKYNPTVSTLQEAICSGNEEILIILLDPVHNFNLSLAQAISGLNTTDHGKFIASVINFLLKDSKKYKVYLEEIFSYSGIFNRIYQHAPDCAAKLLQYVLSDVDIFKSCVKNESIYNEIIRCYPQRLIFQGKNLDQVVVALEKNFAQIRRTSLFLRLGFRDNHSTFYSFPKEILMNIASKVVDIEVCSEETASNVAYDTLGSLEL